MGDKILLFKFALVSYL